MKQFLALFLALSVTYSWAHEGEEEVTIKNNPRFGGRVAAVVMEEDHSSIGKPLPGDNEKKHNHSADEKAKGKEDHDEHNDAKFMSEILVSDENKIRLYFYNNEMKDIDLANFPEEMIISVKLPGMESRGPRISLKKVGKAYVGDLPMIKKKPYDFYIDFFVKNESLHITFKAMD